MRFPALTLATTLSLTAAAANAQQGVHSTEVRKDSICNHTLFCIVPGVPGSPVPAAEERIQVRKAPQYDSKLPRTPLELPKDMPIPEIRRKSK